MKTVLTTICTCITIIAIAQGNVYETDQNKSDGYDWEQVTTAADESPEAKKFSRKIESLTQQIVKSPQNASLYVDRAEQIFLLNAVYPDQTASLHQLEDVLDDMNKAIELEPKNAVLYALRGEYKRDINMDNAGAKKDLSMAITLDPDNPKWYIQRSNYQEIESACYDWKICEELGNEACMKMRQQLCSR